MTTFPITHIIDIYHLVVTNDKESYEMTPSITGVQVTIIPAGADILAVFPGKPSYALHQMFVYEQRNIKNGDKIVGATETFIVRGVPEVFSIPGHYHQELIVEKVVGT